MGSRRNNRHFPEDQQNRKKPTIRHDVQPTSIIGDNEIDRLHCAGIGSPAATHRGIARGAVGRPREEGDFVGRLTAEYQDPGDGIPASSSFERLRNDSRSGGNAKADNDWGLGQAA